MSSHFSRWVNSKFGAVIQESAESPHFSNDNRIARVLYRLNAYKRLSLHMWWRGVSAKEIFCTQFPLLETHPQAPALVSVEFTNLCNLRCVYCTSPLGLRPRGVMTRETFGRFLEGVKGLGVSRVRIVGNGEPTLHPEFSSFISALCRVVPYVSVLTNGQWKRSAEVINSQLDSNVSLIEISVDGGDKKTYERSRQGGSFDRLLENLTELKAGKQSRGSRTLTNVRLMLRPSERPEEKKLRAFWNGYADTVMPQYVMKRKFLDYREDVYIPAQFRDHSYPRCTSPFKSLEVNWNGDVPLCSLSAQQIGPPGLILGNVRSDALEDLWRQGAMRQYRQAHRDRDSSRMPVCKGCVGV
jgi:MoaA/NifB/PqqE/SkfB family radical SAM enzyme